MVGRLLLLGLLFTMPAVAASREHTDSWQPTRYSPAQQYSPSPAPERIVLSWSDDPATTQSVTWRTDTSVKRAVAEIAVANANGYALEPERFEATTTLFKSDLNEAHYHSLTFQDLTPKTLYAYRVGDGENWSEYLHFRTASARPEPFSFIYFGDAQNDVRMHWSRVFREAFREAPRAAFSLHAGDLINTHFRDAEWGGWHAGPAWVNGTIPVIATPGNHEYYAAGAGPRNERYWTAKDGSAVAVVVDFAELKNEDGKVLYRLIAKDDQAGTATLEYDGGKIVSAEGTNAVLGYDPTEVIGTDLRKAPLNDRPRKEGEPTVSAHWRHQFAFPIQKPPKGLEETVYYTDYQGVRFISLDSNRDQQAQIPWLRRALARNPNRWTIVTFHHPIFSPAFDRDNEELRALWKPVLDEYKVDLVLNGHDHTYARTGALGSSSGVTNVPTGYQQAYNPEIGTVYVVSVSGPKMYPINKGNYAKRVAENTQLYQVIEVFDSELKYKAYTATGELYDAFMLEKRDDKPNRLQELLPPERRAG
ncbi:MAG: fibronectin type III domain-containing protein [Pseudomonadota bacterium]